MNYHKLKIYKVVVSLYVTLTIAIFLASIIILFYPNKYHYVYIQKVITQNDDQTCLTYISDTYNSSNYTIIKIQCYYNYVGKNKTIRLCNGLMNSELQDYCSSIPYNYSVLMVIGSIVLVISAFVMILKYIVAMRNYQQIILVHHLRREERRRQRRQSYYIQRPAQAEVINNHFEIPIREISKLEPNQCIGADTKGHIVKIINPP